MAPRKQKKAAEAPLPELTLECIDGPCKGELFDKQLAKRRIGRVVRGNNVHVKDEAVSQAHAEVLWDGKQWVITDLGSSNGTTLNGKDLVEGGALELSHSQVLENARFACYNSNSDPLLSVSEPQPLSDGDTILLGGSSALRVKLSAGSPLTLAEYWERKKEELHALLKAHSDAALVDLQAEGELAIKTLRETAAAGGKAQPQS